jgi:RNA polymerase sigma factor (sigma-70 family)
VDDAIGSLRPGTAPAGSRPEPERSQPVTTLAEPETGLTFPDFYRSTTSGLVAFLMWLGAGAEEAADVAQETMTRAWQNWEGIRYPRTWVRIVASREYCRRIATCHDEPTAEIPAQLLLAPGVAADEAALLGLEHARVLTVLRLLPSRQRQVMAWTYDGYTPAEIATLLGLDSGTVRASLHKARETLKPYLTREGGWSR